ncbi:MAG: BREX-1 system adenine-specific DNA-methyltransferase PglX, partial [Verrucomicrobiae bacterium]|nr:BREX-1 system adenine-specific DNA-methyltransferase PglX [Verrucomicrobiae bacterium]
MLTYAFDLLTLIYEEEGYAPTEIPALILRHNLHGLEICPRAAQLAELALVFKAREKSRRFFQPEHLVRPRIIELRDVRFAENELRDYIHALGLGDLFNQPMLRLLHQFEEAKNFGSLIQPCLEERAIADVRRAIEAKDLGGQLFLRETHLKVLRVLEQAEALTQRYHVLVANPPYLGGKQFNPTLKAFGKRSFPDSRADLFSMFIERGYSLVMSSGYSALVTMESWMFLSSFESFRVNVLSNHTTISMVHMPYLGRGGTSMGINFGTAAAIWQNAPNPSFKGQFQCIRYFECDAAGVPTNFPTRNDRYGMASSEDFLQVSGAPVAYWVTDRVRSLFKSAKSFKSVASPKVGMQTANNAKYLRFWFEVNFPEFQPSQLGSPKWVKYLKGGPFRRWYGNLDYLLRYNKSPDFILSQPNATLLPLSKLREPKCTWTDLTSGTFSCRLAPDDSFHDISGHCFYPSASEQKVLLGLSNTKVFAYFLSLINSSFHFQVGDVGRVPVVLPDNNKIEAIVSDALCLSISDWDNFETSWDFRDQPLLRPGLKGATLEASWRNWEAQSTAAIRRMQELETENNRLFIAAYGLDGELQPEVPEAQITLARAEAR